MVSTVRGREIGHLRVERAQRRALVELAHATGDPAFSRVHHSVIHGVFGAEFSAKQLAVKIRKLVSIPPHDFEPNYGL